MSDSATPLFSKRAFKIHADSNQLSAGLSSEQRFGAYPHRSKDTLPRAGRAMRLVPLRSAFRILDRLREDVPQSITPHTLQSDRLFTNKIGSTACADVSPSQSFAGYACASLHAISHRGMTLMPLGIVSRGTASCGKPCEPSEQAAQLRRHG